MRFVCIKWLALGLMSQCSCVHHLCLASSQTTVWVELLSVWASFGLEAVISNTFGHSLTLSKKKQKTKNITTTLFQGSSHGSQLFGVCVNQHRSNSPGGRLPLRGSGNPPQCWGPGVLLPESALLSPQVVDVAPELLRICSLILAENKVPPGEGGSCGQGRGEAGSSRAQGAGGS